MSRPTIQGSYANTISGREFGTQSAVLTLPTTGLANAAATVQITIQRVRDVVFVHFADVALQNFGAANGEATITGFPAWAQPTRNITLSYARKGPGASDLSALFILRGSSNPAFAGQINFFGTAASGAIVAGQTWGISQFSISYPANLGSFAP